ncbi:hypothetical protein SNEBB_010521 [Seison nebaliae]|nr:hypothetical protein SNEBB_010521 [Seison nebaliae]
MKIDNVNDFMNEEVLTGTTIMAVEYDEGVILGADSRTSSGVYVANRVTDKLTPVTENIMCCRSGSAADTQAIADVVKYNLELLKSLRNNEENEVNVAASLFRQYCYGNRDSLKAGIICAGWDKINGGQVYVVPLGGMVTRQPIAIGGSGSGYIYGYVDSNFKKNMTKEECLHFVLNSVSLAISRDGSSGGVVRLAVINKNGTAERHVIKGKDIPEFYTG